MPTYGNYNIDNTLNLLTEFPKLLMGENLKIDVVGTSGIDVILEICRKKVSDDYSSADMVVDIATAMLDQYGVFTTFWQTPNTLLTGDVYHYYPRVRLGTAPPASSKVGSTIKVYDRLQSIIAHIENALGDVQTIPIYDELSKDAVNGGKEFRYTYNNWNNDYPVVLVVDGELYDSSKVDYVDYPEGSITLTDAVTAGSEVNASYVFKFFSSYELRLFLERAITTINMISPVTHFNYSNFPDYWYDTVVMEATLRALDTLFTSSIFREKKIIFGESEVVNELSSYYSRLMSATDMAKTKIKKMQDTYPAALSGHDVMCPPRILGGNFRTYAYLRGKAL